MELRALIPVVCMAGLVTACSGGGGSSPPAAVPPVNTDTTTSTSTTSESNAAAADVSILKTLHHIVAVGSTVDPVTGDLNPYGLDIAKVSSGKITKGDLVVCNFNDSANVQGTGTSIIALHPVVGSKPIHIINNEELFGCNALAMSPTGTIWNAVFSDNDNPIVSGSGALITALSNGPWHHPFGEAFVPAVNGNSVPAFYVSNAADGSLVRVYVFPGPTFKFSVIATGFPVNGGVPGSILSPSGLNYQPLNDRLYVVDGTNNTLYAINHISEIAAGGIVVHNQTFSGPQAFDAHVIFHGPPLNGPISSALLPGGNIVLGNTLDPTGKNLMVEISPSGTLLDVKNVDAGAGGSIFGMVATGTTAATTKLYFNDDNANQVWVVEP